MSTKPMPRPLFGMLLPEDSDERLAFEEWILSRSGLERAFERLAIDADLLAGCHLYKEFSTLIAFEAWKARGAIAKSAGAPDRLEGERA